VLYEARTIFDLCALLCEARLSLFTVDILVSALSPKFLLLCKNFITDFDHVRCAYYRVRYYYLTIEVSNSPCIENVYTEEHAIQLCDNIDRLPYPNA
jgi:hypothetical protein